MREINQVKRNAALARWGNRSHISRFYDYVQLDLNRGCWLWLGSLNRHGYGQFHDSFRDQNNVHAFRWAYEYFNGEISPGLALDHLCRVRSCVNPNHLEIVTNAENNRRGFSISAQNMRKVECKHGHFRWGSSGRDGNRRCLDCHSINESKRQRRLAEVRIKAALGVCHAKD